MMIVALFFATINVPVVLAIARRLFELSETTIKIKMKT